MRVSKLLYNVRLEEGNNGFQGENKVLDTERCWAPALTLTGTTRGWRDLSRAVVSVPCEVQWIVGNRHVFGQPASRLLEVLPMLWCRAS